MAALREADIVRSQGGKVRLLPRAELPANWDPTRGAPTVWMVTQQLLRALDKDGERGAADLLRRVGGLGPIARDLAYRLYVTAERKGWTEEALAYNGLVVSWPAISDHAGRAPEPGQAALFEE